MALSEAEIDRYARHIVIPGLGIEGQQRLLAARVFVGGQGAGAETARDYLAASGVKVTTEASRAATCDAAVLAGAGGLAAADEPAAAKAILRLPRVWFYLVGDRLVAGLARAGQSIGQAVGEAEPVEQRATDALGPAREAAAGCEAAARTLALLLGWPLPGKAEETRLG